MPLSSNDEWRELFSKPEHRNWLERNNLGTQFNILIDGSGDKQLLLLSKDKLNNFVAVHADCAVYEYKKDVWTHTGAKKCGSCNGEENVWSYMMLTCFTEDYNEALDDLETEEGEQAFDDLKTEEGEQALDVLETEEGGQVYSDFESEEGEQDFDKFGTEEGVGYKQALDVLEPEEGVDYKQALDVLETEKEVDIPEYQRYGDHDTPRAQGKTARNFLVRDVPS